MEAELEQELKKKRKRKLLEIFANHIGEENAISPSELFTFVFERSPSNRTFYEDIFLWEYLKKLIREMNHEGLFYVVNYRRLYVLKTMQEYDKYSRKIETTIAKLQENKKRAREWVVKRKYKNL